MLVLPQTATATAHPPMGPIPTEPARDIPGSSSQHLYARRRTKQQICETYIDKLRLNHDLDINEPGLVEGIRRHFDTLPTRYALDVNVDSLDVLSHKRLLDEARADPTAVSFAIRPVEILVPKHSNNQLDSPASSQGTRVLSGRSRGSALPKPAFGSSPNLQALALEASHDKEQQLSGSLQHQLSGPQADDQHSNSNHGSGQDGQSEVITFYEITVASVDQPKLLSRLSEALSDLGLNIREAHAFNTSDNFSLDVFVVDQFQTQPGENLEELLGQRLSQMPPPPSQQQQQQAVRQSGGVPVPASQQQQLRVPEEPMPNLDMFAPQPLYLHGHETKARRVACEDQLLRWEDVHHDQAPYNSARALNSHTLNGLTRPASPAIDDWEIDITQLQIDAKVASGAFSNLYRGSYCGQEVAVKILKDVADDTTQYQEFLQEVSIMRKVRHKNVVQFIGACTRKPNLCIVFEFMSGGSVYDFIRREGPLRLSQVLKIAVEVSRGMDYLHQRKIIHRDLKAANLLMDDHGTVKIADFGVARIIENTGHMTAETGTYRWMAPEVIEHKPYDEKADVFSFAVVLWELLTCKVPYSDMTPLQAAVGVVQKGLRPGIPPNCPPALADLLVASWQQSPAARPAFRDLTPRLQAMLEAAREEEARQQAVAAMAAKAAQGSSGGLLAKLRGK